MSWKFGKEGTVSISVSKGEYLLKCLLIRKNIYLNIYCSLSTSLLRHTQHITQFIHFKCTVQRFYLFSFFSKFNKLCNNHHKSVLEHFITQIRSLMQSHLFYFSFVYCFLFLKILIFRNFKK